MTANQNEIAFMFFKAPIIVPTILSHQRGNLVLCVMFDSVSQFWH